MTKENDELWLEYTTYVPSHFVGNYIPICGLCGNSGFVDTTNSAKMRGFNCGCNRPCICPNGRAHKRANRKSQKAP